MVETIIAEINRILKTKNIVLIAVDGRCASGKTTLADEIKEKIQCNVIHMDDFFLRPEQRTAKRYDEPGGNIDRERFLTDVLKPLQTGKAFSYRPFDCRAMSLGEPVKVKPSKITVIEGTYSCHPTLWQYYDLHIFMTTTPKKQLDRLSRRSGADIKMFREKWIPLEERYFAAYSPDVYCELVFET